MTKGLLVVLLAVGLGAGAWLLLRDDDDTTAPATTTTTTTAPTTTVATMPLEVYFYRGAGLVPVIVRVPRTEAVATAALKALLAGPPAGLDTSIPKGTRMGEPVTISEATARARFSQELAGATRTAQAQIVYTLTQFPTVTGVAIDAAGSPVRLSNGSGQRVDPASRQTYVDLTPEAHIFVEAPLRDSTVSSPVEVTGTAVVFEATVAIDVHTDGQPVRTHTVTASNGAPERGDWAVTLDLPPGDVVLQLYEPSAQDGSHLHETSVPLHVR